MLDHDQAYFSMNKRVFFKVSGKELSGGRSVRVGFFLGGNCPGGNYPGRNCPYGNNVRGGTVQGELSGGDVTGHPRG